MGHRRSWKYKALRSARGSRVWQSVCHAGSRSSARCTFEAARTGLPRISSIKRGEMATTRMPQPNADDPVKVDSKHYKVEFENDRVRVVRIKYGPGEKSVMHSHPESISIFLTEAHAKFTYPDGRTENINANAVSVLHMDAFNSPAGKYQQGGIRGHPSRVEALVSDSSKSIGERG